MKKRIYCITTALCLVLCIILCIAFAAVCSKAENSKPVAGGAKQRHSNPMERYRRRGMARSCSS